MPNVSGTRVADLKFLTKAFDGGRMEKPESGIRNPEPEPETEPEPEPEPEPKNENLETFLS